MFSKVLTENFVRSRPKIFTQDDNSFDYFKQFQAQDIKSHHSNGQLQQMWVHPVPYEPPKITSSTGFCQQFPIPENNFGTGNPHQEILDQANYQRKLLIDQLEREYSPPQQSDHLVYQTWDQMFAWTDLSKSQNTTPKLDSSCNILGKKRARDTSQEVRIPGDDQLSFQTINVLTQQYQLLNARTCLKLDQGFKSVLRAFRSFLTLQFIECQKYSQGYKHWKKEIKNHEKWFQRVELFLIDLGIYDVSKWELAVVILLIYPAFGPSTGKDAKPFNKETQVYDLLQDEGMLVYKTGLTKNNSEELRDKFFLTPIIANIWRKLVPNMTLVDFFETQGPNQSICSTYSEITRIMRYRYSLEMSPQWNQAFPEEE